MQLGFGSSQQCHVLEQAAEIDFFQVQITRTGEVHQHLHHAVKTMNFAADKGHVVTRVGVNLSQLVLQKLQVEHNGVDGVLDLVRYAAGETSAGGETARHFDFILDAMDGFGVTYDEQGADLSILFLNKIERDLNPPAAAGFDLALPNSPPPFKDFQH